MSEPTVLIVDDESAILDMLTTNLEIAGFKCLTAENTKEAYEQLYNEKPDLILLDWMLPDTSGVEFAAHLRKVDIGAELPIIMLTARNKEDSTIKALDSGVDDYITKPFSTRELISRIRAVLRRVPSKQNPKCLSAEGLVLDPISQRVSASSNPINMGPTEFRLLKFFMSHPDRAYSRAQLLDQVWGNNVYVADRTVDVHIRRLRKALSLHKLDHFIQTVRGTGYRFSIK